MKIELQNATADNHVPSAADFQKWADTLLNLDPRLRGDDNTETPDSPLPTPDLELVIRLVTTTESQTLNQTFRAKDKPTNVLSFPYEPIGEEDQNHLGDLAMCVEVIKREALEQNKSLLAHFAHMTIHGILHLLGYDHIEEQDAKQMEAIEIAALQQLGFENPY